MRTLSCAAAVLVAACLLNAQAPAPAPSAQAPAAARAGLLPISDAPTVLAGARGALGGDKRLSAVKSFVAEGQTRQVQGDNLIPIVFEIAVELPDKYVRRDEIPARENGPTSIGFSGDALLLAPAPPTPLTEPARRARLLAIRQDFARLVLGMFAMSSDVFPLTFTYAGQAEAPQGKADVLNVKSPADNFTGRLFVHGTTHLPIMLTWQTEGRGGPTENRLYYADYREVSGMQFPFRLRRAVGADTVEETTFDRFRINPKIDANKFSVK
jgi:hypothetical protein